jgi:uncharacterized membrane-anchored protein YitT (DUF2179 family)
MSVNKKKFILMNIILMVMPIADNFYLIPSKITSGGMYGIATILIHKLGLSHYNGMAVSFIALLLSSPLLLYSYLSFSKDYFKATLYASIALPAYMFLMDWLIGLVGYEIIEANLLIATIMGSVIQGLGTGWMMSLGGSTGGLDILAKIVNNYSPRISLGAGAAIFNLIIVAFTSIFFGIDRGIASIVSIVITGWLIDFGIWMGYRVNHKILKGELK